MLVNVKILKSKIPETKIGGKLQHKKIGRNFMGGRRGESKIILT